MRGPALLFALLGAGVYALWTALAPAPERTLRIDVALLEALEAGEAELRGFTRTEEERAALREGYIDDEVLMAEALRRGLHLADNRTRQRLVELMRQTLSGDVPDPTDAELRAWFEANLERYTRPESLTLEQVSFPWIEAVDSAELESVLEALRDGASAVDYGAESLLIPRRVEQASRADLVRSFGADFADRVSALTGDEWDGPFESVHGVHLVRLQRRHPLEAPIYDEVEPYLYQDWLLAHLLESQQEPLAALRASYPVELIDE